MTTHDQALFELWLEKAATDEELALPYAKQIESHILWLSGFDPNVDLHNILISAEDREQPQ